jgi:hypothetical protein
VKLSADRRVNRPQRADAARLPDRGPYAIDARIKSIADALDAKPDAASADRHLVPALKRERVTLPRVAYALALPWPLAVEDVEFPRSDGQGWAFGQF